MEKIEYSQMAKFYDIFYANKNYAKEVCFIKNFIDNKQQTILDVGCGTGNHAVILHNQGYNIFGFDKSKEMVNIANSKLENRFFIDDVLFLNHRVKYDIIISFFAVFNHLRNYNEFIISLKNLKDILNPNGTIIIDLHNPQKSGSKTENFQNFTRTMKWRRCYLLKKEFSKITYLIDNKIYETSHVFKIYNIKKLHKLATKLGFKTINFYENYDINKHATNKSKNIQLVLTI